METKTHEAAAIAAALMLARMAALRLRHDPDTPRLAIGGYLHAPEAELVLVPAVTPPARAALDEAVAVLGADALVACAGGRSVDDLRFGVVLRGTEPFRASGLRLWLGAGAAAHLVPDDAEASIVALLRVGLRGCEVPPWDDEADRQAGLALGREELTRALGGR